ncbi:MAG: hypothetical protein KDC12_08475 [Flavobacteriales bacterium]|nr:hypothetical protein [Flavobacteriales bacterium]
MEYASFSELNQHFREKLQDTEVYSTTHHSFLKPFQHALSYAYNRVDTKLIAHRFHLPLWLLRVLFYLKSFMAASAPKPRLKRFVVLEGGRYVTTKEGKTISSYFDKILRVLPHGEVTTLLSSHDTPLDYVDIDLKTLNGLRNRPLSARSCAMFRDIVQVLDKARKSGQFTDYELQHIASQLHVFFEDFRFFDQLLTGSEVKVFLFENHYHREGMIAAIQAHNARAVEIQHGLIARNDLYYVYDDYVKPIAAKAFFPDHLLTFGAYWRDLVLEGAEHPASHVHCVGDYTSFSFDAHPEIRKEKILFITSQKNMASDYIQYIRHLADLRKKLHNEWKILVKLHPAEPQSHLYHEAFDDDPQVDLVGSEVDLHEAFAKCSIHLSIYSTTLFDAIGHDLINVSLQQFSPSADYARDMVSDRIAHPIEFSDDPFALVAEELPQTLRERSELYDTFNEERFLEILTGHRGM